jgi:hypothetical protein
MEGGGLVRHRLALRYERALLPEGDCAYAVAVACLVVVPRRLDAPQPLIALLFLLLPLFAVPMLRSLYLLSLAGGLLVALALRKSRNWRLRNRFTTRIF